MKHKRTKAKALVKAPPAPDPAALLSDIRALLLAAREQVPRIVDFSLTTLYRHVGRRIRQDILREQRAGYGEGIVSTLGRQLEVEFGRGFSEKSLRHTLRFAEAFPDEKIVSTLRRQLTWSHFKRLELPSPTVLSGTRVRGGQREFQARRVVRESCAEGRLSDDESEQEIERPLFRAASRRFIKSSS